MACHNVLVPKYNDPTTPIDYMPIGIGNIVYRLLAKPTINRLQPFIKAIISQTQTAFVKGGSITDKTILMRKIIHSFNLEGYREKSFALKADINRGFDTVEWSFIEEALKAIGMPE